MLIVAQATKHTRGVLGSRTTIGRIVEAVLFQDECGVRSAMSMMSTTPPDAIDAG
jgi:hypothetical protein